MSWAFLESAWNLAIVPAAVAIAGVVAFLTTWFELRNHIRRERKAMTPPKEQRLIGPGSGLIVRPTRQEIIQFGFQGKVIRRTAKSSVIYMGAGVAASAMLNVATTSPPPPPRPALTEPSLLPVDPLSWSEQHVGRWRLKQTQPIENALPNELKPLVWLLVRRDELELLRPPFRQFPEEDRPLGVAAVERQLTIYLYLAPPQQYACLPVELSSGFVFSCQSNDLHGPPFGDGTARKWQWTFERETDPPVDVPFDELPRKQYKSPIPVPIEAPRPIEPDVR